MTIKQKSTVKSETKKPEQARENLNPEISPIWVDNFQIAVREDHICMLRFLTNFPEGVYEQVKIMTGAANLKRFVDVLCSSLDYYPQKKPEAGPEKK